MNLTAVWKPWFVYRPHQLARRLASSLAAPPDPASANDGLGHIAAEHNASNVERMVQVTVAKLDDVIGGQRAGMMKIDVEGHEEQVLEGAAQSLHAHRIRHVVFEDHEGTGSRAMALLRAAGYESFSIGWSMRGPVLAPAADGSLASPFEAPSYLATTETRAALEACARSGWMVLQHQARVAAGAVEA
jgi:hypothetical protein